MMMMVTMDCFCSMVDRWKVFSLISSRDYCQRSLPSRISDTPRAGFEPAQNLSSSLVEWSYAVVIITTPLHHNDIPISDGSVQFYFEISMHSLYHKSLLADTSIRERSSRLGLSKKEDLPKQETKRIMSKSNKKTNYEHATFVPNHQQSSHINICLTVQIDVDMVR